MLRRFLLASVRGVAGPLLLLVEQRALLGQLVIREIKTRTSGSLLGGLWLIVQPGLQLLAIWFLLEVVLRVKLAGGTPLSTYFLISMLPWLMMQESLLRGMTVLSDYAAIYQRTAFPIAILPLVPLTISIATYGVIYLFVLLFLVGAAKMWVALIIVLTLFILLIPAVYLLAVLGLFLRDLRQVIPVVLTMLMYLTPIMYAPDSLPPAMAWMLDINPIADIIALIHSLTENAPWTAMNVVRPIVLWALCLAPAIVIFRRAEPHMREIL